MSAHPSIRSVHVTTAALLALWGVSWALSYLDLGVGVALAIAAVKAVLVVLVFMELAVERFSAQATAITAGVMVAVFVTLTLLDVLRR